MDKIVDADIEALKAHLTDFLAKAREKKELLVRSEGARLLAVAITDTEKVLGLLHLGQALGHL